MRFVSARWLVVGGMALSLAASGIGLADAESGATSSRGGPRVEPPPAPRPPVDPLSGFDPLSHTLRQGVHVASLGAGRRAELTLDPGLQAHVQEILRRYEVPYGALMAVEPRSGRVLAYVSHSSVDPRPGDLVRDAAPPAASVFKMVTAAALLEAGVGPRRRVCYSGGASSIQPTDLVDRPGDLHCVTMSDALGKSANSVFAKLAIRHLDRGTLSRYASAFGFGHSLPFDVPTERSEIDVPSERLEFARTAAGFWHSHLSPFHGALLAATVANRGQMPRPSLVERVVDRDGRVIHRFEAEGFRQVIGAGTARRLGEMMRSTVASGTARGAFFDPKGLAFLPGIEVAAKTGSLSSERPYRGYSWWVGFAPADKPRIALSALVVNSPKWRIKSSFLAREALRQYLILDHPLRP